MSTRYVTVDHDTPMLLPPDLREWVPGDHMVHFIMDAVETLDLSAARVNERGTGSKQYPPRMLLGLLIYSYATGVFSSRQIERNTYDVVAVRYLSGDTHPDHDTLCTFRRCNEPLLGASFAQILQMAAGCGVLKVGGITVAVDGTKVLANASKHGAVSYQWAEERERQLEIEIKELMAKAETADSTPLQDGLSIPEEIQRRHERKALLAQAKAEIEARAYARAQAQRGEYESQMAARQKQSDEGKKPRGRPPQAPSETPAPTDQYNFTDPESRIMKSGSGDHFEQAYNAQAAVEVDSRLIVGQHVCNAPNDKQQLIPTLESIEPCAGPVAEILTDSGFFSEPAIRHIETTGTRVLAAVKRTGHERCVADLEKKDDPAPPPPHAPFTQHMIHRVSTKAGRLRYKLRQQTVEPVFGIIKEALGFRRFSLRGLVKAGLEWTLVCLAYNLKRLFIVNANLSPA